MNSSSESADQAANYVLATKWVIEGLLLPIIGSVGIVGKNFQILIDHQKVEVKNIQGEGLAQIC